jgi:hypothetical protein
MLHCVADNGAVIITRIYTVNYSASISKYVSTKALQLITCNRLLVSQMPEARHCLNSYDKSIKHLTWKEVVCPQATCTSGLSSYTATKS